MYSLSAYYFDKFTKNYPNSFKKEEASFLAAHSNYLASPVFSLDQKLTVEAIDAFQKFIYTYPSSKRIPECNQIIKELNKKIERKAYEIAYQYYHTKQYKSAINAFERFVLEHLGTSFKEDALYFRFLSGYHLATGSVYVKLEDRIAKAVDYQERFAKSFPNSKRIPETVKKVNILKEDLNKINNKNSNNDS
jgi:outer membrane protein assembly factor BamD